MAQPEPAGRQTALSKMRKLCTTQCLQLDDSRRLLRYAVQLVSIDADHTHAVGGIEPGALVQAGTGEAAPAVFTGGAEPAHRFEARRSATRSRVRIPRRDRPLQGRADRS